MAKKLNAKSWIIIGATTIIMGSIAGYSLYSLNKVQKEQEIVASHNYAIQETSATTRSTWESGESTYDDTDPTETSYQFNMDPAVSSWLEETEDPSIVDDFNKNYDARTHDQDKAAGFDYSVDLIFTGEDDKNFNNTLIDLDTISIDGQIIDLPSTYADLAKYFTFNEKEYTADSIIENGTSLTVTPKTGVGEITFFFESNGATPLKNCVCRSVQISSYNYYYEPDGKPMEHNMTMSLVSNIKFGETYEDIKLKMPIAPDNTYADTNKKWTIYYEYNGIKYNFTGANDGLVSVYIVINNEEGG